ncbi:AraC family transcriptional regulator [Chitinimonas sp.]|uniref:AraC family transcriptional regulator n=1 Tax=Chitinimonas sp. TaxID=1934313 RepID=UPI002F947089
MHAAHALNHYRPYVVGDLRDVLSAEALFERMPDVVFSVKDRQGRYLAMSSACVPRCRLRHQREALGRTAHDLFPHHMAERYRRQDELVFGAGRPIVDSLDLTLYSDGQTGWCLSNKQPVCNREGEVLGLVCISKDLTEASREGLIDEGFARAVDYVQAHCQRQICVQELTEVSGLSAAQLDRRMKRVFQASTGEFVRRTRLENALHALCASDRPIADIAQEAGFFDQSALHRQCRSATGLSPRQVRRAYALANSA